MAPAMVMALLLSFAGMTSSPSQAEVLPLDSASGPESLAFDGAGDGPYTGVADGRILRWSSERRRWSTFAVPPRPHRRRSFSCNGTGFFQPRSICGRPLGLQFHRPSGRLYIADAFYGLLAVGAAGGVAAQVAAGAEGRRFRFANAVDVDQETGAVFLTDSSSRFGIREYMSAVLSGDSTGRLVMVHGEDAAAAPLVLLAGLGFPNGVALGGGKRKNQFILVAETGRCRVLRYWMRGAMTGKKEVFAELPGFPDNIRRLPGGGFWVAINTARLRSWRSSAGAGTAPARCPVAVRLGEDGRILEVVDDCAAAGAVSEVVETAKGKIWIGSVVRQYVEVFNSTHDV